MDLKGKIVYEQNEGDVPCSVEALNKQAVTGGAVQFK
jgi:hypothetical protein